MMIVLIHLQKKWKQMVKVIPPKLKKTFIFPHKYSYLMKSLLFAMSKFNKHVKVDRKKKTEKFFTERFKRNRTIFPVSVYYIYQDIFWY